MSIKEKKKKWNPAVLRRETKRIIKNLNPWKERRFNSEWPCLELIKIPDSWEAATNCNIVRIRVNQWAGPSAPTLIKGRCYFEGRWEARSTGKKVAPRGNPSHLLYLSISLSLSLSCLCFCLCLCLHHTLPRHLCPTGFVRTIKNEFSRELYDYTRYLCSRILHFVGFHFSTNFIFS